MRRDMILITGANGQLGSVLTGALQKIYGANRVLTTDIRPPQASDGPLFEILDILDPKRLAELIDQYEVSQIYHLAAILSAKGEQNPLFTWKINMDGLFNVLEVAKEKKLSKVFFPSSIAVFGNDIPKDLTPQDSVLRPSTVYGISKAAAENWCQYYFENYDLDIRSVRYPGVIGYQTMAGGGTTDYAVDIFHHAVKRLPFNCFLKADSRLPMIYMDDAIRATIEIMEAPATQIKTRTSYNIHGMNFTPLEITEEIQKHRPDFRVNYLPDQRQAIADTWPASVDDSHARMDWNWSPKFNLKTMTKEMLYQLSKKYKTITS